MLGHHTIDKTIDEHLREIAALANDPQTLIFLDTNIVAYLYKLHEEARREFFAWSDRIVAGQRLAIPGWAANEYLSRVTSKTLDTYTPKSKEHSQIKKALETLHETASLFVDEPLLRKIGMPPDRAAYLEGFRRSIDALNPYLRAFSHQFDPGTIHEQVVHHLSCAILDSDLAALCARASKEGEARFEHRLPPGFRDERKGENRFGDLIIWFEILDKAAASARAFPKVLFVTNDEKSDWVYAPKMRIEVVSGTRKAVGNSNPEIKLVDPRLVAEFRRQVQHPHFAICTLSSLIEGLSKVSAAQFTQLAAAIQIETLEEATSNSETSDSEVSETICPETEVASSDRPDTTAEVNESSTDQLQTIPIERPALQYDLEALQDSLYQTDVPSEINAIIKALRSLNWYTQNPAIQKISAIRNESFTPSSWFVLGRNIYQAACGNSQKAIEFMASLESQLMQFPSETAKHILAGMLFETYFDAHGRFRERAKFGYAAKLLSLVCNDPYEDVRQFILYHLRDFKNRLTFLPGDRGEKSLRIESIQDEVDDAGRQGYLLKSVSLDGLELMCDSAAELTESAWVSSLFKNTLDGADIKAKVSKDLAIPEWALVSHFDPEVPNNVELTIPKGRKLSPKLALMEIATNTPEG